MLKRRLILLVMIILFAFAWRSVPSLVQAVPNRLAVTGLQIAVAGTTIGTVDPAAPVALTDVTRSIAEGSAVTLEFSTTADLAGDTTDVNFAESSASPQFPQCRVHQTNSQSSATVTTTTVTNPTTTTLYLFAITDSSNETGTHRCVMRISGTNGTYLNITLNISDSTITATPTVTLTSTPVPFTTPTVVGTAIPTATTGPSPTPLPSATPIPTLAARLVSGAGRLPLRTAPYLGASIVGYIFPDSATSGDSNANDYFQILGKNNTENGVNMWYQLKVNGRVGWSSGVSLELNVGADSAPWVASPLDNLDSAPDLGVIGIADRDLLLYHRPSTRSQVTHTINVGTRLSIIGRTREITIDDWYHVRVDGIVGWVQCECTAEFPAVHVDLRQVAFVPVR
ncbi:MAG: SH3 domain-containing protein [Phototrophicaceae bacterium]